MGRPKLNNNKVEANKEYLKLSIDPKPFNVRKYSSLLSCGHVEVENQTLAEMRSTCALGLHKY